MFFATQNQLQKEKYDLLLKIIGALSRLSTDSIDIPYLYYRMAENIFCKAFGAKNLSRSNISIDASKDSIGIGLKTFLHKNGSSIEKIAEFNKERPLWADLPSDELLVNEVAKLRNARLRATAGISGVDIERMTYHCVSRKKSKFIISETPMRLIDIPNIRLASRSRNNNTIAFSDGLNDYSFNLSKSTLFKRFSIEPIHEIEAKIFEDPFELLERHLITEFERLEEAINPIIETIYLPLYSSRGGIHVPERSGLNQWNASGRPRDYNEAYIPIPSIIRARHPNFFPPREDSFTLRLPNGTNILAKVCQDNDKALMSNPNSTLGRWLLRDILSLAEGELATYQKLEEIGIDTVEINRFLDNTYEINFKELGAYEAFRNTL